MEKRIELEKRGKHASEVTELNLDNCRSTTIVGLTDEFTALETLSLINVGLTSLKGFPKLPNLKKLELSDNRITGGLNNLLASTKLTNLNLSGNKIKDLEELKPLASFKELKALDLFNNEITSIDSYREKIFNLIPSLVHLDGFDVNDQEIVSDGDEDDDANGNDSNEEGNEDSDAGEQEESDLGEEEEDEDDDDDENGDPSLADVYNDISDDNSDYVEEADGEHYSDGEEVEEEEEDEDENDVSTESPVRGTKRKHEDDNDG